ncbi:MAG: response regulator [Fimbriimonadaceae bacterium]|nr:response regulator [Chitinophagales bacterium]
MMKIYLFITGKTIDNGIETNDQLKTRLFCMDKKKCILICDDDADILNLFKYILEPKGFEVIGYERTEKIFSNLSVIEPDIIFIDLNMAGFGGENAVMLLNENNKFSAIPKILFSGNEEIEEISKKINATGFLKKPFDFKKFDTILQLYLN